MTDNGQNTAPVMDWLSDERFMVALIGIAAMIVQAEATQPGVFVGDFASAFMYRGVLQAISDDAPDSFIEWTKSDGARRNDGEAGPAEVIENWESLSALRKASAINEAMLLYYGGEDHAEQLESLATAMGATLTDVSFRVGRPSDG